MKKKSNNRLNKFNFFITNFSNQMQFSKIVKYAKPWRYKKIKQFDPTKFYNYNFLKITCEIIYKFINH